MKTDRYLDLKGLARLTCISVRTLRDDLKDPEHPLPHFRKNGKVYVLWSEVAAWMEYYRVEQVSSLAKMGARVEELANL